MIKVISVAHTHTQTHTHTHTHTLALTHPFSYTKVAHGLCTEGCVLHTQPWHTVFQVHNKMQWIHTQTHTHTPLAPAQWHTDLSTLPFNNKACFTHTHSLMRTLSTLLHTQPFSPPHTAPPCIHAVLGREQHVPPLLLHPTPLLFPRMKTRGTRRKEGEVCVCACVSARPCACVYVCLPVFFVYVLIKVCVCVPRTNSTNRMTSVFFKGENHSLLLCVITPICFYKWRNYSDGYYPIVAKLTVSIIIMYYSYALHFSLMYHSNWVVLACYFIIKTELICLLIIYVNYFLYLESKKRPCWGHLYRQWVGETERRRN